jgi:hypothetical protein
MKKRLFILFAVLCFRIVLFSQQRMSSPVYYDSGHTLTTHTWFYFLSHAPLELDSFRLKGAVYMRFRIDSSGVPFDISFNKKANPVIANFLRKMLLATVGKWQYDEKAEHRSESEYLLLPVYYTLQRKGTPVEEFSTEQGFALFDFDDNKTPGLYTIFPPVFFDTNGRRNIHLVYHYHWLARENEKKRKEIKSNK